MRLPKPKRTKVAPVVPMRPLRYFCSEERTFCRNAAAKVIGIHNSMPSNPMRAARVRGIGRA